MEGRKLKARVRRELAAAERERFRATMKTLRAEEREAKIRRRERLKEQRELCRANVVAARELADEAYRIAKERALEARRAKKAAAAEGCRLSREFVKDEGSAKIAHARARSEEEKRYRDELRRLEQSARERAKERKSKTAGERRSESDDAVAANLSPELLPLWRKVRRKIKGTDRMSRTEAFLHYVEEHPDEVHATMMQSDRQLAREQRDHYARQIAAAVPF